MSQSQTNSSFESTDFFAKKRNFLLRLSLV